MNGAYQNFKKFNDVKKENKKAERSPITLQWYNKISEMLESPDYEDSHNFLYSVQQFIEDKEYISDKQIEICQRIYDHPRY